MTDVATDEATGRDGATAAASAGTGVNGAGGDSSGPLVWFLVLALATGRGGADGATGGAGAVNILVSMST